MFARHGSMLEAHLFEICNVVILKSCSCFLYCRKARLPAISFANYFPYVTQLGFLLTRRRVPKGKTDCPVSSIHLGHVWHVAQQLTSKVQGTRQQESLSQDLEAHWNFCVRFVVSEGNCFKTFSVTLLASSLCNDGSGMCGTDCTTKLELPRGT